jgi:hypothetical protein
VVFRLHREFDFAARWSPLLRDFILNRFQEALRSGGNEKRIEPF